MKFSIFIQPPSPTPRRTTGEPAASTIVSPSTRKKFRAILETYLIASRHDQARDDRPHRRCGGCLGPDGFESRQRTIGRRAPDPRARRADAARARLQAADARARTRARCSTSSSTSSRARGRWRSSRASRRSRERTTSASCCPRRRARARSGRSWVDAVASRRSAGLILVVSELTHEQIARLNARSIPFVVVDPAGEPAAGVPSVGATNWNGGLTATRHLLELGHTPHRDDRRARRHALQPRARGRLPRGAGDRGPHRRPRADPLGHVPCRGGLRGGQRAARAPDPPTAIFAGSDLQAFGVYEAARVKGIEIPTATQRRRLRRPADGPLGRAAADHDPPAADRDGSDGGSPRARPGRGPSRGARDDRSWCARAPDDHSDEGGERRW